MRNSPDSTGLNQYLLEVTKHKQKYLQQLNELRTDLVSGHFSSRDYLATERLLQVFTELCIGLAKHCLKKQQGHSSADAYQTFSVLKEQGVITSEELSEWKKIIGLRNGLVHDYLKIDLLIIEQIIKDADYNRLNEFSDKAIAFLTEV